MSARLHRADWKAAGGEIGEDRIVHQYRGLAALGLIHDATTRKKLTLKCDVVDVSHFLEHDNLKKI